MFLKNNFYAIIWAIFIFALNWGRQENLPSLQLISFIYFDKFAHFIQFCILMFLMLVGFYKQQTFATLRFVAIRLSIFIGVGFAILLEIIQFIRLRPYFEWADLLADVLGCGGGLLIFYFIYKFNSEN